MIYVILFNIFLVKANFNLQFFTFVSIVFIKSYNDESYIKHIKSLVFMFN